MVLGEEWRAWRAMPTCLGPVPQLPPQVAPHSRPSTCRSRSEVSVPRFARETSASGLPQRPPFLGLHSPREITASAWPTQLAFPSDLAISVGSRLSTGSQCLGPCQALLAK